MYHNQRTPTQPNEPREGPRGRLHDDNKKVSKVSRLNKSNISKAMAVALLFASIILLQWSGPTTVPSVIASESLHTTSPAKEPVAMRQDLVAKSAISESSASSSPPSLSAGSSIAAAVSVKVELQATRMQEHNISHDEVKAPVYNSNLPTQTTRFKQTHNLKLDAEEYKRIMLLPTRNTEEAVSNAHKALEACYSCKPITPYERYHANIPDRLLLSDKYLPFLSTPLVKAVLNVGIRNIYDIQAEHFFRAKNPDVFYVTIEPHPEGNIYGASYYGPERSVHYQDYVENINNYHHPPFDVVLVHGVIGWGIDGEKGMQKFAAAAHKAMADGGLLYMWRNFDSPADASVPKEKRHGTVAVLDYLLPYFVRFNGTWHLNPGATVESEALVDKHHEWTGRLDLYQRVNLGPDVAYS